MRKFKLLMAATAISVTLFTSCKKELKSDQLQMADAKTATLSAPLSADLKAKFSRLRASLPAGHEKRAEANALLLLKTHPEYRDLVMRALNLAPVCNDNTAISQWLDAELADWNDDVIFLAIVTGMLDFPTYDALLFENSSENQTFGINGEYTQDLTKGFKDLKRFWNIQSEDLIMAAMHGNMLLDRNKIIRTDMAVYGDSPAEAAFWADLIIEIVNAFPQYRQGDHPIFTFNAFALEGFAFPPVGIVPDKIVMGDGMLHGFSAIGFEDVAPRAILAHEFAHHIQFQLNLFGNMNSPAASRRIELMADAFSAYYLSHSRGASMQWKRVQQFLTVFFNLGDCATTSNSHHGTPTQRMAAAAWGFQVADNAQKQGHILTSQEFAARFDAALPGILAQ